MAGINVGKMVELLKALGSSNNQERQQAETMFQQAKTNDAQSLLLGFTAVLADGSVDEAQRRQCAVLLRQLVTKGSEKDFAFAKLAPQFKQEVAAELLRRFEALTEPKMQQKVGDVLAKLAEAACDKDDQRGWLAPGQRGWPQLLVTVFKLADASANTNSSCCESAIRLLKDIVGTYKDEIVQAQQQLGSVVQNALAHADAKVRCAAFVLVCELVGVLDKKAWAPLMATGNVLIQVLQQLCQPQFQDELQECLQNYLEMAAIEPDFFKQQLQAGMEPAKTLATMVKTKEGIEEGVRNLSLEWLVTFLEKKPKWLAKSVPTFAPLTLECCMNLMLEVEAGEDDLKAWAERMDDEEGEEDCDELYHTGAEAMDRIVEAMGIESVGPGLFQLIGQFSSQDAWQAKLAALTAVKQTVEYVEETDHVNEMAKLLLAHMDHPHPRVRYTAFHALGQVANDQAPQFQDAWHKTVMPVLLQKMDDPIDRVASMAMSAFVSFGEELENALMVQYADGFMQKLVARLQSSKHRMVQEESITSIAVIAGVIEKDFAKYYDGIMPLLKHLVMNAKGEKENRLRGKAFECMSLLGMAVGKEKFLPDAQEAVAEMLKTPLEADDLQREYIKEASERICKCLKSDFAPFLPHLLPNLFKALKLEGEDAAGKPGNDDDDDEFITVSTSDGKLMKVRSSKFDEIQQAVQTLATYCSMMEGAFFDYVAQTAEALLPLLSGSDDIAMLCEEARSSAFETWASLIKCARTGAEERKQPATMAAELLRTFLQKVCAAMQEDTECDSVSASANGIAECLKAVGSGCLNQGEVLQLAQQMFKSIDESFERTRQEEQSRKEGSAGAPAELQQDEDDDEDEGGDEETCRRSLEDALGAIMEVAPQEFAQCLPECANRLKQWLSVKQTRALGLFLACDIIQHIKEQHSEQTWPVFMPAVFQCLKDKDGDVRTPAAYAISLAAPLAKFGEAAPQAFRELAQIVSSPAPKKRDDAAKIAMDNCVSALFALARHQSAHCPAEVPAWQLVVSKLPIKEDEEEAKKVHKAVADLLMAQHAGLVGPDQANLGKILSAFAEVYKQENLCTEETDGLILNIFKMLPRDNLLKLASGFTEKQQKKIEKMLS